MASSSIFLRMKKNQKAEAKFVRESFVGVGWRSSGSISRLEASQESGFEVDRDQLRDEPSAHPYTAPVGNQESILKGLFQASAFFVVSCRVLDGKKYFFIGIKRTEHSLSSKQCFLKCLPKAITSWKLNLH